MSIKQFNKPYTLIDRHIYHAAFKVDGKIIAIEKNEMISNAGGLDVLTIWDDIDAYDKHMESYTNFYIKQGQPSKQTILNDILFKCEPNKYDKINITDNEYAELVKASEQVGCGEKNNRGMKTMIDSHLIKYGFIYDKPQDKWLRQATRL